MLKKCAWEKYDKKELKELESLSAGYRDFWTTARQKESVLIP